MGARSAATSRGGSRLIHQPCCHPRQSRKRTCARDKILLWISLWQQILWAAQFRRDVDHVRHRRVIRPNGDIFALAHQYLVNPQQPPQQRLLQSLVERRDWVVNHLWSKDTHLRQALMGYTSNCVAHLPTAVDRMVAQGREREQALVGRPPSGARARCVDFVGVGSR
jgi:hypothetical protein